MNGCVVWEGPSRFDGTGLVVVLTGLKTHSSNSKTGPVVQSWILRQDMEPTVAVRTGADSSICGDCKLRGYLEDGHAKDRTCYVVPYQAPLSVWRAYKRGVYPRELPDLTGLVLRIGSYGDPTAVPLSLWKGLLIGTAGHTGYTHQWKRNKSYRDLLMASVDTQEEQVEAQALGWRTFRVKRQSDTVLPGEVICPASEEAGKKTTCSRCKLCSGSSLRAKNVTISVHGSGIPSRYERIISTAPAVSAP